MTSAAWLLFITIMTMYYVALSWMPSILIKEGYTDYAAFGKTTLMTAVGIVGVLVSAWLIEAVGRKWVIGVSAPVGALVLAVVLWMAIAAPETRGRELDRITDPSGDTVTAST